MKIPSTHIYFLNKLILVVYVVFMALNLNAQAGAGQQRRDSLRQLLSTDLVDTVRFETTCLLVDYFCRIDIDSARKYAYENIDLAKQIDEQVYLADAWSWVAEVHGFGGELDSLEYSHQQTLHYLQDCSSDYCRKIYFNLQSNYAFTFNDHGQHQKAINILEALLKEGDMTAYQKVRLHYLLSQCYIEIGDYDAAFKQSKQLITSNESSENDHVELIRLKILFRVYNMTEQWEKAEAMLNQRLVCARKMDKKGEIEFVLYQLANFYLNRNKIKEATPCLNELLQTTNKASGEGMYAYALGALLDVLTVNDTQAIQYAEEIKSILNSDQSFRLIHTRLGMYAALSNYYLRANQPLLAEQYAQEQLSFVRLHQTDTAQLTVNAFQNLSQTQAAIGKYEAAWHTLDTFHQLQMAMVNRTQADAMAQMSVEMDLAENELARQKAEQATVLEQQALANRTRMFIFVLVVVALVLGGIVWAYRRAERDKQLINEKKQLIEQSLAEKEVLLREIHHRVKNNLQIISSLLDKQARKSSDEAVKQLVKQGQERIQSMALIHQNLYQSEQLSGIDIKSYLLELIENIQKSQSAKTVEVELNIDQIKLDIDTAIPVGLILNELLTNSYKYAFTEQDAARISVDLQQEDDAFRLQISDNGIGFSSEQAAAKSKSLGLNLVRGLVRQLEGSMEWLDVKQGASVVIRF